MSEAGPSGFRGLKIRTLGTILSGLLLCVALGAATVSYLSLREADRVGQSWRAFEGGATSKAAIHGRLHSAIGFGGVIHEFKNFILRRNRMRLVETQRRLMDVSVALTAYTRLDINGRERAALRVLQRTLRAYADGVAAAERLASEGATTRQIDAAVHIDDTPAIGALAVLDAELVKHQQTGAARVHASVDFARNVAVGGAVGAAALFAILIAAFLWFTRARVGRPLAALGTTMETLAADDTDIEIPYVDRGDEIGAMARTVQVFKESAIQRRRAEAALRDARELLEQRVLERTAELEQEIAEREQVETALRDSERRISGILDIAPEAVIVMDESHRILVFNQGAESIFGYEAQEVMGRPVEILLPERFRAEHADQVQEFSDGSDVSRRMGGRAEVSGQRRDGSEFPAEASISKLELDKETVFTVMLRDASDRKRAERALEKSERDLQARVLELSSIRTMLENQSAELVNLAESLDNARNQAEAANRAKSEFLANMSHELRTPLNAIIGFSEILSTEALGKLSPEQSTEYAADILSSGHHLLGLINDILDLSKVESGAEELHEEDIDVPAVINAVARLVHKRAEKGSIELTFDIPDNLPPLHADERKLKQILMNLMTNAIKFTGPGGTVAVKTWHDTESGFVCQVADTGIGIAQQDIPKALSQFGQIDSDLGRRYEGTGLGLPLTKSLVELHGGSLDLQSRVGVGTTVTVRFPATRIVADDDEALSAAV